MSDERVTVQHAGLDAVRVTDPVGGKPDLRRYFAAYDEHFRASEDYAFHYERLVAEYAAGADAALLRSAFDRVLEGLRWLQRKNCERYGAGQLALAHRGKFAELHRTELVLAAFALCLHVPRASVESLLEVGERGDVLLESMVAVAAPGAEHPGAKELFRRSFDGLYDALRAPAVERAALVNTYLRHWYTKKMAGFAFKDVHLESDPLQYVGYFCFEAAGVVAALDVDDATFRDYPHYPADLVRMAREA